MGTWGATLVMMTKYTRPYFLWNKACLNLDISRPKRCLPITLGISGKAFGSDVDVPDVFLLELF